MSKIRYGLFVRFEKVLITFHKSLEFAAQHYKGLFDKFLKGESIYQELVEDMVFFEVQDNRYHLQEEQKRISRILGGEDDIFFTLSEIKEKAGDRIEIDIVELGKESILFYKEIERYMSAISEYYSSKIEEYKGFFERIYTSDNDENGVYMKDGSRQENKQGMLIKARV